MPTELKCKFCKESCLHNGGITYIDLDGVRVRVCWKGDCQEKYHAELDNLALRTKRALKLTGKCIFKVLDGFCEKPIITGEFYCKEHLTQRCDVCGAQATHYCPQASWSMCDSSLCAAHSHSHQYYN